jgi:hypothetical protein
MAKIKKSTVSSSIKLIIACAAASLMLSCTHQAGTFIPDTADSSGLGKIDHFIPLGTINEFKSAFAVEKDSLALKVPGLFIPETEAFNKPALLQILKDPACAGIRFYYGVKKGDKRNEMRLMLVGVDAQGKDLLITKGSGLAAQAGGGGQGGLEFGQCPPCQN